MNNVPSPLPKTSDEWLEHDIKRAGADVAPRITPTDVEHNIVSEHYFTAAQGALSPGAVNVPDLDSLAGFPDSLCVLTFCVLTLRNGYTVTGESACASVANFNAEIGRKIARQNAAEKIWPLLGYELRCRLAAGEV